MIKTLLRQVKEYKTPSILTSFFAVAEVVMEVLIPLIMAQIIDNGIGKNNISYAVKMGFLMLLAALISLAFAILCGRYAALASAGFAKNLRKSMFENIQTFAFSNIDKFSSAGLVTRMTTDVTHVQNSYIMVIRLCVRALSNLVLALVMAFTCSAKLTSIFFIASAILGCCLVVIIKTAFPLFTEMFKQYDRLNATVQENIGGIRVVKSFVREDYENTKTYKAVTKLAELSIKAERIIVCNMPIMQLTIYSCILAISWFGSNMVVVGDLTTGKLLMLNNYILTVMMSLMMLSMVFVMMTISSAAMKRIAEVLNEKADIVNPEKPVMEVADGSIEFQDVTFSYRNDGKNALNHINVKIKSGETIGIIGGTGGSKSTFVQMLPRFYDPTSGTVLVGGKDVKEYDLTVLRDNVSMVLQKNVLFSGTIKDNLRWGDPNATDEDMIRVCKLAQADDFIQSFPEGYDTWIEQGGSNVSGGQKQRLCIARALLKKPAILILDDSTSAVDTRTDAMIRKAFREEIPNTTKLIIAQRISSIEDADRIIVLEEGQINGVGTHEELLATNTIYREVYESQKKGGIEDEA